MKDNGERPGMTRVMKSGQGKRVKTLPRKISGKKNGLRKMMGPRKFAKNGARVKKEMKNGMNHGEKLSLQREEKSGVISG